MATGLACGSGAPLLDSRTVRKRWIQKLPECGLAVLVAGQAFWCARHLGAYLHDDTFISMRYARHLATGSGLVFNPGERVEGYTNFLWTLLLATASAAGFDLAIVAASASALLSLALTLAVYAFVARRFETLARAWALVAAVWIAMHPLVRAEAVGGLETILFTLLFVGAFAAGTSSRWLPLAGPLFGLATLTRPEGALFFGVWFAGRIRSVERRGWVSSLVGYAAVVVPHLVFRLAYYGDLLPNTFHAKVGSNWAQVERGGRYFWEYGVSIVSLPVLLLATFGGWARGWRGLALASLWIHSLYVVAIGGDFAPTGRFLTVTQPLVAFLFLAGLMRLQGTRRGRRLRGVAGVVVALAAIVWCSVAGDGRLEARNWVRGYPRDLEARRYLGTWLRTTLPADVTVAVGSIGAIGYYSGLRILDTFGLTNLEIGRRHVEWMGRASAGHEKGDADFVLARRPEIIVFDRAFLAPRALELDEFVDRARSPTEQLLVQDRRFFAAYGLRTLPTPVGFVHYLERVPE